MNSSRRTFLSGGIASAIFAGTPILAHGVTSSDRDDWESSTSDKIIDLFESVPGTKAVKIWAPAANGCPEFLAEINPRHVLFIASAFKCFVLGEALRQVDSPDIDMRLQAQMLDLNESVWSPDSQTLNPPYLSGKVSERTALEAMVIHSDNTGADMILKHIGADSVRDFLERAGLEHTFIPNSTRQFLGYLANDPNWRNITWDQAEQILDSKQPLSNPPLNRVQTMASTAYDLVSYYSRALQGKFFTNPATLNEFRAILSRADAIQQVIPLGASAFLKGGEIDVDPFHALCLGGGMYVSERWVYFGIILNWHYPGASDPETAGKFITAISAAFDLIKKKLS